MRAQQLKNVLALVQIKMLAFHTRNFRMLQKQQKWRLLKQTEDWEYNSFINMVSIIDIDALKIYEQSKTN